MNNNIRRMLGRFTFLVSLLGLSAASSAAEIKTTVLNDGTAIAFGYNDSVREGNGYIHIAVLGAPSSDPMNENVRDVYYMLVNGSGDVLIDATRVSATTARWGRPHIALTSERKAVITWNGNNDGRMHYAYVNPRADSRNGGPADPAVILEVEDTVIGVNAGNGHNSLVVDANDVAHVFKSTKGSGLYYFSFVPNDGTGAPDFVTTELNVAPTACCGQDPVAALDSGGNLHVLFRWDDPVDGLGPVAYLMLDGTNGSVLIDATPLYDASATLQHASHYSIAVDDDDRVHAIYGDKRFTIDADSWCNTCEIGGHMFYARLDPSLAAQDGSASDMATLREGGEVQIWGYWYSKAFMNSSGSIDVFGTTGGDDSNSRTMTYVRVTPDAAGATVGNPRVFSANVLGPGWSKHFVSKAGNSVIWSSGHFSVPFSQPLYPLVMAPLSRFTGGGGGGGGGAFAPLALGVLLLAALGRLLTAGRRTLAILAALSAMLLGGPAAAEDLATTVLNDGIAVGFGRPDAAVDSAGNIHIVATGSLNPNPASSDSSRDIYYMMVQPDGTVLIDATKLTTVSARYTGPQIVMTANDRASVTYKRAGSALMTVLVNPALDNRDGDAADPAVIRILAETTVGSSTSVGHLATAIDIDGATVHVVWPDDSNLNYLSYTAATGAVVTDETPVAESGRRGITPGVDVDSDGNVHALFQANDDSLDFDPVAYVMIDGDDGAVLIGRTFLVDEVGIPQHGSHLSLVVDGNDKVHLIYGDKRNTVDQNSFCWQCENGGDMFYTRLNPARHPQDGGFGSIAQLREGSETNLGGHWYSKAFRSANGTFRMYSTVGGNDSDSHNMIYTSFKPTSGGASVTRPKLATTSVLSTHWSKHYVTSVADRVIWVAGGYNVPMATVSFPLVMAPVETFAALKAVAPSAGGGTAGGAMPVPALLLLGFAGLAAALRRRRN
jgi:hypothetical protein